MYESMWGASSSPAIVLGVAHAIAHASRRIIDDRRS